jgi:hypothetical protein
MSEKVDEGDLNQLLNLAPDSALLRSNIPAYDLVGFACATADDRVALTLGLVTGPPCPESRPFRVVMSHGACRDLLVALERLVGAERYAP